MKRTRVFQITVLLLVIVAVFQVGYWLYDQHTRGAERTAALVRLYDQESTAARALLAAGFGDCKPEPRRGVGPAGWQIDQAGGELRDPPVLICGRADGRRC